MVIRIIGADGKFKAESSDGLDVRLVYNAEYQEGDVITLSSEKPIYVITQLEDSIAPFCGYLSSEYALPVPFGEKRICYSPKCFTGDMHLLWAREATCEERKEYRNLALNPLDNHSNKGLFPHAHANVETRGESVFAAHNAINGNISAEGHGAWPYESWGINRREDAEMTVEFGREVRINKLVITLRADFPHDNWWKQATVRFSDGSEFVPQFKKTGSPQSFDIDTRVVTSVTMSKMIKDETDPSPFPALVQLECWGKEIS